MDAEPIKSHSVLAMNFHERASVIKNTFLFLTKIVKICEIRCLV